MFPFALHLKNRSPRILHFPSDVTSDVLPKRLLQVVEWFHHWLGGWCPNYRCIGLDRCTAPIFVPQNYRSTSFAYFFCRNDIGVGFPGLLKMSTKWWGRVMRELQGLCRVSLLFRNGHKGFVNFRHLNFFVLTLG